MNEFGNIPKNKKKKKDFGKHVYIVHKRENIFKKEFIPYDERFLICLQPFNINDFSDSD